MSAPPDIETTRSFDGEIADLYAEYAVGLRRMLRTMGGSLELAEDLASRTFEEAIHGQRRGVVITRGWLATVARRRLIDHWRRSGREIRILERLSAECHQTTDFESPPLDPSVGAALIRLDETHRRALVLRYVADQTVKEVADALDRSPCAAESLIRRARQAARLELAAGRNAGGPPPNAGA